MAPVGFHGQMGVPVQKSKKALSSLSKPAACSMLVLIGSRAGLRAPSRTMARMWSGNRSAYVAPRNVP